MMNRKLGIFVIITFVLTVFLCYQSVWGCTIFFVNGQSTHYFASNEDWTFTDPAIRIAPGDKNNYGYLVFGWESYLPNYPQGGVNEHGLCLDWAMVGAQNFKPKLKRQELDEDIIDKILKKCRNVKETIRLVKQYNCNHLAEEHLLVADRNGDSCVIEWSGNDYLFLQKTNQYQVITNFALSNHKIGWYPCRRFTVVDEYLKNAGDKKPDLETVRMLLQKSHQEEHYPTIYSYIIDEKNLEVYVYLNHDYSKYQKFGIQKEIDFGAHQIKLTK